MIDPRIRKTKQTVLAAAERLMMDDSKSITYTSLSRESAVSRRTIYAHWPTIDSVVAEVLARKLASRFEDLENLTPRERLTQFLESVRDGMSDPLESTALLTVVSDASQSEESSERLHEIVQQRLQLFRAYVGSISQENFAVLMGPLFTSPLILRIPISEKSMTEQIAFGMSILE